jgi:hypothetical protein
MAFVSSLYNDSCNQKSDWKDAIHIRIRGFHLHLSHFCISNAPMSVTDFFKIIPGAELKHADRQDRYDMPHMHSFQLHRANNAYEVNVKERLFLQQ